MVGDAVPARATRATHRTRLRGFGLSAGIAIALAGCEKPLPQTNEFAIVGQVSGDIWLVRDNRTTCEYLWTIGGGLELRSDGYGNVTPNCAGSHGYVRDFPYGERPDQAASGSLLREDAKRLRAKPSGPDRRSRGRPRTISMTTPVKPDDIERAR